MGDENVNTSPRVTVSLTEWDYRELQKIAAGTGDSLSGLAAKVISAYVRSPQAASLVKRIEESPTD